MVLQFWHGHGGYFHNFHQMSMNRILQREGDRRRLFLILCILHSDDVNVEKACRLPRPAPAPASPPSTVLPDPSTRRNSDNQWWSRAEALIISHPSPFRGKWTWWRIGGLNFNSSSKWFRMKGMIIILAVKEFQQRNCPYKRRSIGQYQKFFFQACFSNRKLQPKETSKLLDTLEAV